jgi:hypothetical protein
MRMSAGLRLALFARQGQVVREGFACGDGDIQRRGYRFAVGGGDRDGWGGDGVALFPAGGELGGGLHDDFVLTLRQADLILAFALGHCGERAAAARGVEAHGAGADWFGVDRDNARDHTRWWSRVTA